jgi:hypothetical protein
MPTILPVWTLTYGGVTKSFADWKLDEPSLNLESQGRDILSLTQRMQKIEVASQFPYSADIKVFRNLDNTTPVQWFRGRITTRRKVIEANSESIVYTVAGGWWYFENVVYNQIWKSWVSGTTFANYYSSLVLLNQNTLGAKRTTGQQITDAINYAITEAGIPITIGTITPAFDVPIDEKQDITVAEVIKLMLRWHPRAVAWFDYSTTLPTFHCKLQGGLPTTSINIGSGRPYKSSDITRRDEMEVPCVVLKYRITGEFDGQTYRVIDQRKFPTGATGRELGALCLTIDLQGPKTTLTKGSITTAPISAGSASWWRGVNRKLGDTAVTSLVITNPLIVAQPSGAVVNGSVYPNRLIDGTISDWMGFNSSKVIVSALASYDYFTDGYLVERVSEETVFIECTATTGTTGDYATTQSFEEGEATPVGLETALYHEINDNSLYEGSVKFKEKEASGLVGMGSVLNLVGIESEWATMKALVQSVNINVKRGETDVKLGVPGYLSAGDLIELLRVNRVRRRFTASSDRTEGLSSGGGSQDSPNFAANDASTQSGSAPQKTIVSTRNPSNPTDFQHTVDVTLKRELVVKGFSKWKTVPVNVVEAQEENETVTIIPISNQIIRFRKWTVCVGGVTKKAWVLASDFFTE